MNFLDLPSEILIIVLYFLDGPGIARISQSNRFLRDLVTNSSLLTYKQHLFVYKAENNYANLLSFVEKTELLKKHENSWVNCNPQFSVTVPITFQPGSVYDLTNGVYILGENGRQKLRYIELPDEVNTKLEWKTFEPKIHIPMLKIVDFVINLHEHDLVALVNVSEVKEGTRDVYKIELFLHQFSTGNPHPEAKQPVLTVMELQMHHGAPGVNGEIVGDHIALVTYFWRDEISPCHVAVYNWKTGKLVIKITGRPKSYAGLIFLSPDRLLLPNALENRLEVWKIPCPEEQQPEEPLYTLGLFEMATDYSVRYISCRSEPNPTGPNGVLKSKRPFRSSPEDSIILIYVRIHGIQEVSLLAIFVHRSALLMLEERAMTSDAMGAPVPLPWDDWAPEITFCHDCSEDMPSRWITTTCGQRYAMLPLHLDEDAIVNFMDISAHVTILDFGIGNIRKVEEENARRQDEDDEEDFRPIVRRGPHRLDESAQQPFAKELISYLPFVESRSKKRFRYDGVLMDEGRIIGIKTNGDGQIRALDIVKFG